MKTFIKLSSYVILLNITFLMSSCKGADVVSGEYLTVEEGAIPLEFGKKGQVLLINSSNSYFTKRRQEVLSENYKGEYEFVDIFNVDAEDEKQNQALIMNNPKYKDADKYRYIFSVNTETLGFFKNDDGRSTAYAQITVYDRVEKKVYQSKKSSVNYLNFSKEYLKKLDQQRIINRG